ncbi:hypothetical protein BGY98DRAFT_960987 [Russula aff. rugulosa BPL654]|nr:hypothetical protein BGY98DRAFT_960987 [Russula aff. rugulosa BPL654]
MFVSFPIPAHLPIQQIVFLKDTISPFMSTATTEDLPSHPVISRENLLFDYPEADVILRSRDSFDFRVLKIYIVHSSPILGEKVLISPTTQPTPTSSTIPAESDVDSEHVANAFQVPLVQLPIDGAILFSLLTYIFPVPPVLPSTVEQTIELLSVAQMYKMDIVLTHIRNHIAQQEPPFIREETAFLDLAEEHKLDMMPGSFLHDLWKYHQNLNEFKKSSALTVLRDSGCESLTESGLPHWLDIYISDIGTARLVGHIERRRSDGGCESCSGILGKKIRAASSFSLPVEETRPEGRASPTATSPPKYSDMPEADIVLRSSDLVNFHVHRSVLVASSPFFRDMFSLPQPRNDAVPEALPVVHLSEDAEIVNSLISMLYPVSREIPLHEEGILTLLAAATKYDMDTVQSFIRAEVSRKKLLSFTGAAFHVYAVAYSKGLVPEMATAARDTLAYPLTFENLGHSLRSFDGGALRDLADFRLRSTGNFSSNLKSFSTGPSKIWVGCPTGKGGNYTHGLPHVLPRPFPHLRNSVTVTSRPRHGTSQLRGEREDNSV